MLRRIVQQGETAWKNLKSVHSAAQRAEFEFLTMDSDTRYSIRLAQTAIASDETTINISALKKKLSKHGTGGNAMAEFAGFVVGLIRVVANIIIFCAAFKYLFWGTDNGN